jgi:hypothetical protein
MRFLILRVLTHSELGMFHAYRRQGKEGSRQRAINFDGDVVDRVFPAAHDSQRIAMDLRYDTDNGVATLPHFLTRQAKNWRLEGNCPQDMVYDFVDPGCLFALEIDAGVSPAVGSWVVLPPTAQLTKLILADGATGGMVRAGMIALHGDEGHRIQRLLHHARPDMFSLDEERVSSTMSTPSANTPGRRHLPPRAERTAEIMGNTGHTFATAVADIVDNAISADATEIDITFGPPDGGHGRWLSITDNGHGMSQAQLDEAMTIGSDADYDDNALGKFGFGLKGASWSQARIFTVVTRRRGESACHLTWDKKDLRNWEAIEAPLEPWEEAATALGEQGTSVFWKEMKAPTAGPAPRGVTPYSVEIRDLQRHLGLVFHRFLEGDAKNRKRVTIRINRTIVVEPNNPVGHDLVLPFERKPVRVPLEEGGEAIVHLQPFLMPSEEEVKRKHPDNPEASAEDLQRIGMYGNRNQSQGLFVYRNDRLIKFGGWDGIWTPDEKTKLARVVVDFDSKLDGTFDINITKMQVKLPGHILEEIKRLATPARNQSRLKYSKDGKPAKSRKPLPAPPPSSQPPITGLPSPGVGSANPFGGFGEPSVTTTPTTPQSAARPTVTARTVTTKAYLWRFSENLMTGGRELWISDRDPDLVAVFRHVKDDPVATAHLAAFLESLDGLQAQKALMNPVVDE